MRNKIVGLIIGSCVLVAAAAPQSKPTEQEVLVAVVDTCAVLKRAVDAGNKETVRQFLSAIDQPQRKVILNFCYAYSRGYEAGQREMV